MQVNRPALPLTILLYFAGHTFWGGFSFRTSFFLPIKESMKSLFKTFSVVIVSFFFLSASIWEGSVAIAPSNVLPETGFYAATNSFPQNTVIRVINLENEKTVEVTVKAGLDNPSLLILLSKEAAAAVSLPSQYTGRVRIMQSSDAPLAFSELTEGKGLSSDPDHNPMSQVATTPLSQTQTPDVAPTETRPEEMSARDEIIDMTESYEPSSTSDTPIEETIPETDEPPSDVIVQTPTSDTPVEETVPETDEPPSDVIAQTPVSDTPVEETVPETDEPPSDVTSESNSLDNAELSLVPTEERPPQGKIVLPEGPEVAPIVKIEKADEVPLMDSKSPESYFSASVISLMEKGKFYIQLMSFRKPELVESAINAIRKAENTDKLIIQATELGGQPIYRILLGPMEQSESQTLLQKFKKSGYTDAFVWIGK
jgi:hypothetical protein